MGSLDIWSGLAQGVNQGLGTYLKIRQIQNQEERDRAALERDRLSEQRFQKSEARALRGESRLAEMDTMTKERYGWEKDKHTEENAPIHKVSDILKSTGLDAQGQAEIAPLLGQVGVTDPNQNVSKKTAQEITAKLLTRPDVQIIINTNKLRSQNKAVEDAQNLYDATQGPEGSGSLNTAFAKRQLDHAIAQRDANPAYTAGLARIEKEDEKERKRKADVRAGRTLELTEQTGRRAEEKAGREKLYAPAAINKASEAEAMALAATDPVEKAKYKGLAKTLRAAELEDVAAKAKAAAAAWGAKNEVAKDKTVVAQTLTASKNFYGDLEKALRARVKQLQDDPDMVTPGKSAGESIRVYNDVLMNIAEYERTDALAIQRGKEPPNYKNLQAWRRGEDLTQKTPQRKPAAATPAGTRSEMGKTRYAKDPQGNLWEIKSDGSKRMVKSAQEQAINSAGLN